MENSRNKSFVSLKLCALLCSIIKSHLSWDMSDPFVQCIHTVYTTHPLDASQSSHNQIDCQGITALRIHKVQYNTRLQASTGELGSCPLTIKVEVLWPHKLSQSVSQLRLTQSKPTFLSGRARTQQALLQELEAGHSHAHHAGFGLTSQGQYNNRIYLQILMGHRAATLPWRQTL
jgi:hypothetical protein